MPSTSAKQHRLMAAVAHNPSFAKKVGIPQSVGRDFTEADKGRKFAKGGDMKESKSMMKKEVAFMEKKGAPKSMVKHEMEEAKMKRGGMAKKYAGGGFARLSGDKASSSDIWDTKKTWNVKGSATRPGLDEGNKSADGVAQRGKTRGVNVVMKKRGGMCK